MIGVKEMLDFLTSGTTTGTRESEIDEQLLWSPPANVYELEERLYVLLEIAGMKSKEFTIRVENHTLLVRGERRTPHYHQRRKFHSIEWNTGLFEKRIPLPEGFDLGSPKSRYMDGILEVSFPAVHGGETP